jgi:hypothetical protein
MIGQAKEISITMTNEVVQTTIDGFVQRTKPLLQGMRELLSNRPVGDIVYAISDESASHVIRACFYASMTSDEGKWPRVTLQACSSDASAEHIANLNPPLAVNAPTIAKLAHSLNGWCSLGITELNGIPMIVGILPPVSVLLGTFVTQRATSFSTFKISIRCPGNIDVICENGILSYKAGVVSQYQSILSSKALERLAAIMETRVAKLAQSLGKELGTQAIKRDEQRISARATSKTLDSKAQLVVSELVWRISEIGLGGILVVTNRPESSALSYKYPTNTGRLQGAVVGYWRAAHEDSIRTCAPSPYTPSSTLIHEGVMLRECLAATARLAGTDGAIVLGTDFSLHGFGALIGKSDVDESNVDFIDGAGNPIRNASIVSDRGSRHQSAVSFIIREEGVVVFVVSQDGHVTVLENHGGVVRVETELRADGV